MNVMNQPQHPVFQGIVDTLNCVVEGFEQETRWSGYALAAVGATGTLYSLKECYAQYSQGRGVSLKNVLGCGISIVCVGAGILLASVEEREPLNMLKLNRESCNAAQQVCPDTEQECVETYGFSMKDCQMLKEDCDDVRVMCGEFGYLR